PLSGSNPRHPSSLRTELRSWFGEKDGLARSMSNGTWMLIERVLGMCMAILVSVWVARFLGPEQFGILNYALAFVAFFTPLASLGINNILVKELIMDRRREGLLLGSAFGARLMGTLTAVGLCVATIAFTKDSQGQIFWAVVALAIAHLFNALDVAGLWLQSKQSVRTLMYWRMGITLTFAGARVIAILTQADLFTFVWISAAEIVAIDCSNLVAYYGYSGKPQRWRSDAATMGSLFHKSWPLILSTVAASIYLKIDQIMIAEMIDVSTSGVYAVAARISEVWYFIPQVLATALFPSLLNTKLASVALYERRMQICLCVFAFAATSLAIIITFTADWIIQILFGPQYSAAADILRIHIWAGVFIFLRAIASKWMIAENLYIFSFVSHGVGAVINVLLNLVMIPKWGALGSAVATVISYAAASYLFTFCSRRTWPMGKMMTEAILWPVFLPFELLRQRRNGKVK
ncbi:MAG TPA: flippase, partial [Burkholderiales bacterium]|nr:flippase [Burkholderiales bacterium]